MSKAVIAGWVILVAGTILWLYGYFATGHPSLFDWHAFDESGGGPGVHPRGR